MTCERYWRDGIVLVEHGADDPHRDGCDDCVRAHASRQELIEALAMIGDDVPEDPYWQAKVWERIEGSRARPPWRWRWQLAGALAAAAVLVLWLGVGRDRPEQVRPSVMIIKSDVLIRSAASNASDRLFAHVKDLIHVDAGGGAEIRIYRANRVVLQCRPQQVPDGCVRDRHRTTVDLPLSIPGAYDVIVIDAPFPLESGQLDEDVGALESAAASYYERKVLVL